MRFVLLALVAARLVVAAGDPPLNFLPADTKVVIGIHVSAIRESALFKNAGAEAQKLGEDWTKLVAIAGFDPLKDIDEILIASPADQEKAATLVAVRGRFDLERMGAGAKRYHGVALVGDGTGGNGILALLDATTAVAGEAPAVRAAIDRGGKSPRMDVQLAARATALSERFDIWGMGERPQGFVSPAGRGEQFDSIDRFEFGMRVSNGLELAGEVHARSPQDAAKLAGAIEGLKMMMGRGGPQGPKVDVKVAEGTVKISVAVSEDELMKAIAAQAASAPKARQAPTITGGSAPTVTGGPPVVVSPKHTVGMPDTNSGGTNVFVLPGKK